MDGAAGLIRFVRREGLARGWAVGARACGITWRLDAGGIGLKAVGVRLDAATTVRVGLEGRGIALKSGRLA